MKYRGYKFNSLKLTQQIRKLPQFKKFKNQTGVPAIANTLSIAYKNSPQLFQTMECMIHAEEYRWLSTDQQVYFFETSDMAYNIMRGSYNLKDSAALYVKPESFVLMLPDDFLIAGKKGSGLLVTVFNHALRGSEMFDKFFDALDVPRLPVHTKGEQGDFTVCVDYQEKIGSMEYMRCAMPNTYIEQVMKMNTLAEYKAFMTKTNCFDYFAGMTLSGAEQDYQFELMRLVCGFLVYKHALPERLRDGLPNAKVDYQEYTSQYFKKPKTTTICQPASNTSATDKQAHYRSWHFRQLMADRFYKGEHEGKKIGSRIVFVSDAMVNRGDAEVATVEEMA
jgi:hypothetical protein